MSGGFGVSGTGTGALSSEIAWLTGTGVDGILCAIGCGIALPRLGVCASGTGTGTADAAAGSGVPTAGVATRGGIPTAGVCARGGNGGRAAAGGFAIGVPSGAGVAVRGAVVDFGRGAFAGVGTVGLAIVGGSVGGRCTVCDPRGDTAGGAGGRSFG